MLFVVGKIVFMDRLPSDTKFGLFTQWRCRLLRLWSPS